MTCGRKCAGAVRAAVWASDHSLRQCAVTLFSLRFADIHAATQISALICFMPLVEQYFRALEENERVSRPL